VHANGRIYVTTMMSLVLIRRRISSVCIDDATGVASYVLARLDAPLILYQQRQPGLVVVCR